MFNILLAFYVILFTVGAQAQNYVPGRVIVKLRGKASSLQASSFASKMNSENNLEKTKSWSSFNLHSFQSKSGESTEQMIEALKNDPDVEYVEPDYLMNKQSLDASIQSYTASEVHGFVAGFGLTTNQVHGVEAWSQVTSNNNPIVAIIDTGIDLNHVALSDAIWTNTHEIANNGLDDDGNGYIDDVNGWNFNDNNNYPQDCDGHGTHVAGIIRGTTQDLFKSPHPDAPIIKIMPLKFLDCYGEGSTSNAISAIYYAVRNGAKVLNNSWGGGSYSRALHEAIIYSYTGKTVFIAASGNASNNNDAAKTYPASYDVPNVISVAATTSSDALAYFSNFGASSVHLAAPGTSILSAYPGDHFTALSGTSMAAPFISGVAALIMNEKPTMNGYQVKSIIAGTVDMKSQLSGKVMTGGRVNHLSALSYAKSATINSYQPEYGISVSSEDRALASALASGGAGCGLINDVTKMGGGNGGTPIGVILIISVLLLIPILMIQKLKNRKPRYQRAYERFEVSSHVSMKVGDSEVVADLSTISLGGVGVNTQTLLEQGSVVTLKIQTPDGNEMEVKGKVVWKNKSKSYGIQFVEANSTVLERIGAWTRMLMSSSN